jgi:hypothetical protein
VRRERELARKQRAGSSMSASVGRRKPWLSHKPSIMFSSRGSSSSPTTRSFIEPTTAGSART